MFFVAYAFKGHVHAFAERVKVVSHSSCRTSVIFKYFCPLQIFHRSKSCRLYLVKIKVLPGNTPDTGGGKFGGGRIIPGGILTPGFGGLNAEKEPQRILFVLLIYVPSQQLWSWRDSQFI